MKKIIILSLTLLIIVNSATMAGSKQRSKFTPEKLLQHYDKKQAVRTRQIIEMCKKTNNYSTVAMTLVAQSIFLTYRVNPRYMRRASYGGKSSKAVKYTRNGKISRILIYVGKRRDPDLKHIDKAYGNDTFMHEMLHALAYVWREKYGKDVNIHHDTKEGKRKFKEYRKLLVKAIYDTKIKKEKD